MKRNSVIKPLKSFIGEQKIQNSNYVENGKMTSSQQLLTINQNVQKKEIQVSDLYIPKEKRKFKESVSPKKKKLISTQPQEQKHVQFNFKQLEEQINEIKNLQDQEIKKKKKRNVRIEKSQKVRMRLSFSDGLIKYDDVKKLFNPLRANQEKLTLKKVKILKKMIKMKRYPVAEYLIHCPEDYDIFIDSIIIQGYSSDCILEQSKYRQPLMAPNNSQDSLEEIDFRSSSVSSTEMIPQPQNRKEKAEIKKKAVKVVKESLDLHGFDTDELGAYPHQYVEGQIPLIILKQNLQKNIKEMETVNGKIILQEFNEKVYFPTFQHIQMAFEQYCLDFNAQHFQLETYFKKETLSFRNQTLPQNLIKAICVIIPVIAGLKTVVFDNNNLMDDFGPCLLLASFMNPNINQIKFKNNFMRMTFSATYKYLMNTFPNKITEVIIQNSIGVSDHLDLITLDNHLYNKLQILNLSNNPISPVSCRNIGSYLINSLFLRNLDVSNCKLQNQGTRSIIDGLNRNKNLNYFNFSSNFMSSSVYEFSIKIAKILTRHEQLMHIDLSCTGLRKEEVLFLGMAISSSKSCLGIHLSANNLDYYERIFLRTLADAQVHSHFRNMAQEVGSIRSQKERFQIQELKNHDFDNIELQNFVQKWNFIDQQRLGVDKEINQILKDLDITEIFRQLKKGNKSSAESNELLQDLIQKIEKRREELAQEQIEQQQENEDQLINFDLDATGTLTNFQQLGLYNMEKDGSYQQKKKRDLKEGDEQGDDFWIMQNALKIDRIKKRIEVDADKQNRAKSAGEMALKFMGINKIAYELLLENPMTGYMNDVIFSRILGNEDIINSTGWKDTSQCYICEKWDKIKIEYHDNDHQLMKQNTAKLDDLHQVLEQCIDLQNRNLLLKVPQSKIQKMYQEDLDRDEKFGEQMIQNKELSIETDSDDKIFTESFESISDENQTYNDIELLKNNSNLRKIDEKKLQKLLPKNIKNAKNIYTDKNQFEISSESDIDTYKNLKNSETKQKEKEIKNHDDQFQQEKLEILNQSNLKNIQQMIQQGNQKNQQQPVQNVQAQQEAENKKTKLVKRTIFFQGAAFVVEEEISVDSDEEYSVITSEDDFIIDDDGVKNQYKNREIEKTQKEIQNKPNLLKTLNKNRPNQEVNEFGRKKVYIVASFNDWQPIELNTFYEIKTRKSKGFDPENWSKQEGKSKSKKKDENIVMYTNYIPTGKHFFYYIFQNKFLFLSPKYDIVRFKGSNVFLNTIVVKARTKELVQVVLGRNVYTTEQAKFNKDKSVWRDFQEDTPEFLMKMLEQDLAYSKLARLTKTPEDQEVLKQTIFKFYLQVKNVFLALASNSSYPVIGVNDCTEFVRRSGLFGKHLNLARMDQQMIATNVTNNKYKQSAERELHRYEFIEFIVRLSLTIYKEPKKVDTLWDAYTYILEKDILPKNPTVDGLNFREEHMYNLKTNEIFVRNLPVIQRLYEAYLTPAKKFITLEECTKLIRKAGLDISEFRINPCYAESMMSRIDTMSDQSALLQMKFVEFLVFISRVAHEVYKGTRKESLLLHLKVDRVLAPILDTEGLTKIFSYNQESDHELSVHSEGSGHSQKSGSQNGEDEQVQKDKDV